jgi:hypothetical protein
MRRFIQEKRQIGDEHSNADRQDIPRLFTFGTAIGVSGFRCADVTAHRFRKLDPCAATLTRHFILIKYVETSTTELAP